MPGRSVNICERGIALVLAGELVPGESVSLDLMLPEVADPVRARAVVRHQSGFSCGMEFRGLSAEQRAIIRDCLKKVEAEMEAEKEVPAAAVVTTENVSPQEPRNLHFSRPERARNGAPGRTTGAPSHSYAPDRGSPRSFWPSLLKYWPPSSGWTLLLIAVLMVAMVFWWEWNRGWEELESGPRNLETAVEKPEAQVPAEEIEKLLIHRVEPIYPAEARAKNLQAIIALDVIIGSDGSVESMRPLNGPDILARAAMDSLRWWKFQPYRLNGNPVAVETTMAVEFKP
jgi:outer membrane biosynthesis protein TonB